MRLHLSIHASIAQRVSTVTGSIVFEIFRQIGTPTRLGPVGQLANGLVGKQSSWQTIHVSGRQPDQRILRLPPTGALPPSLVLSSCIQFGSAAAGQSLGGKRP